MPLTCPSCGAENPDGARFCNSCGSPIGPQQIRKERKFATALFADIVGSTSLAEREDPEVVQSLVGRAFDRLSLEIERHGGLLEKFLGDAVLAVFGVPTAHEDDPERAVRAALEMHGVLSEMNRGFATEGKPELAMRIGIEAGEVLVDLERVAGPRDRMLTGDAVNTAARLQAAADPGAVIVGSGVFEATKAVIDYRQLAPLDLKGKAEPVPAWEALRIKARRRGERAPLGLEARLIGRDEELTLLKQTLQRVESEGRPALVTVLGPAGVGKSRLSLELLRYVDELPQVMYWRKGRCLAYGNLSYSALAEAVKAQCEILEDDPPEIAAQKANRAVEELFGGDEVAPEVRTLVGAGAERSAGREELFDAWRRFLERMAARYPLVLVLEDIHWADDGLLDFIDHVADWAQGPIFLLTLSRPELLDRRPTWGGGKRNYAAIYLDPLAPEENAAMVDDLLSSALPEDLKHLVVERSEGNPLFTEEIVRMFIDRGVLRQSSQGGWELVGDVEAVDVPRSIQGLIAARLDSLPSEEKAVLQDAAVVGRTFWLGAAERLSAMASGRVREALGRLRLKEILITREPPTFSGETEFAFRHVLIRDVAYDSLPKALRADKHVQVAAWAEERAGERRDEIAELLATHYAEALRYKEELGETNGQRPEIERRGYLWARAAGDRALRLWQKREALNWYRWARGLAERTGAPDSQLAELWEATGEAAIELEPFAEAAAAFERSRDLFEASGAPADAGRVEVRLAFVAFQLGRDADFLRWSQQALSRLEPLGESPDLAEALNIVGWYHWRRGHAEEAEPLLQRAVDMARRVDAAITHARALHTLGLVYAQLGGRWREGLPMLEESYRLAKETRDLHLTLRCTVNLPAILMDAGEYERAETLLREGIELSRKTGAVGFQAWTLGNLADLLAELGRLEEAEPLVLAARDAAIQIGERPLYGMKLQALAYVRILQDRLEEAEGLLQEAGQIHDESPEPQAGIWLPIARVRLLRGRGLHEEATRVAVQAVDRYASNLELSGGEILLLESVRGLTRSGRRADAQQYVKRLREIGHDRPSVEAITAWAEGLFAEDPAESLSWLEDAAGRFESLGKRLDLARCLLDVAAAQHRVGHDPRPALERAHQLFVISGAPLLAREAEGALAAIDSV